MKQDSSCCGEQESGELQSPLRNRYYYAKEMGPAQFRRDQIYYRRHRWLMNRLTVGKGVLCGLRVEVREGKLLVHPGSAIDGLGREIIVPSAQTVDPWVLEDPRSCARRELKPGRYRLELYLCYDECCVLPVKVPSCDPCQPGSATEHDAIQEWFRLELRLGSGRGIEAEPPPDLPGAHLELLASERDTVVAEAGKLPPPSAEICSELLRRLRAQDCEPPDEACLLLAYVMLEGDRNVRVVPHRQPPIPSNEMLLTLLMRLCQHVEHCCEAAGVSSGEPDKPGADRPTRPAKKVSRKKRTRGPARR